MTCSPFGPNGIDRSPGEPGGELLVGLDEAVAAHAHDDRPQLVEDLVGTVGLRRDLGVQADQRLAQLVLDQTSCGWRGRFCGARKCQPRPET